MFKYELHCHERIASRCGVFSPKELVFTYKNQGYDGVVISDHFFNGNCAVDPSLPWKERVEEFCRGYEECKREGEKVGLKVFFAFEYTCTGADTKNPLAGCDFLIYGLGKEWLLSKDESILSLSVNEFMRTVKEEGGFVIQAHPFRLEHAYMDHISLFPDYTDAVEVLNANANTLGRANNLAKAYAKEYGFYRSAGSDAHGNYAKYLAAVYTKNQVNDIHSLINEIKNGVTMRLNKNKFYEGK